jgi:hypothetical protein
LEEWPIFDGNNTVKYTRQYPRDTVSSTNQPNQMWHYPV